jgi:hypothetical protein
MIPEPENLPGERCSEAFVDLERRIPADDVNVAC